MPLTAGTRLGTYEVLGPLGAGGMGEVYRARDLRLRREVAIKVLPAEVSASQDRLARFEQEARTVAGLNHPNIVTLYSVEDHDGVRFLTMELVEGRTLTDLIAPGGLPLARILELAIPLTDALVAAHERGVIHRDLKPGNVMVTRDGRVKVLDFGLAKRGEVEFPGPAATLVATLESPVSGAGQVLGTLPYMAPEQIRGESLDARSDLFSFGILLYELATGLRPFTGGTSPDITSSILRDTPALLTRVRSDLPEELEHVICLCLEKNPRERAQSALDVNTALRRVRKGVDRGEADENSGSAAVATIAVLPFANRSQNVEDEYFSDGLADELLGVLTKIKGLRVIARSSAFMFKGRQVSIAEIGKSLNVATVLEGSVRKAGNRVRISVQLVEVASSSHLWSETYDRTLDDIFAVQDDIAQSVVKELRTTLLGEAPGSDASGQAKAEVAQAAKGRGTDPEAHRIFLLARHLLNQLSNEDSQKAIEYLERAVALDPEFALAWRERGRAHMVRADMGWTGTAEGYEAARADVHRALSLAPNLAEAHASMAWIRLAYDWDRRGAAESIRRGLELAPRSLVVLNAAAAVERTQGHHEQAIAFYHQALEQDPLNPAVLNNLGTSLLDSGRHEEAIEVYRRVLEINPHGAGRHGNLSQVLALQGRGEEALEMAMQEPDEGSRLEALAIVFHQLARTPEADAAPRDLVEKHATDFAYQIAKVHGVRREADAAFEWLENAYRVRDGGLSDMSTSPYFRFLHGDPRWAALLKQMGFDGSA